MTALPNDTWVRTLDGLLYTITGRGQDLSDQQPADVYFVRATHAGWTQREWIYETVIAEARLPDGTLRKFTR